MMRTTLNLPDDVYEMARSLSVLQRISLGDALAILVREAQTSTPSAPAGAGGFPSFPARKNAPTITLAQTLRAIDEDLA